MLRPASIGVSLTALALASVAQAQPIGPEDRASWTRWTLNCQGCHRPEGDGTPGGAPPMRGVVASFLKVDGGRAYLTRVPGVASAPLSDQELADVLTFMLRRYDGAALPADFKPYTAAEIAAGRKSPLRTDTARTRQRLIARLAGAHP